MRPARASIPPVGKVQKTPRIQRASSLALHSCQKRDLCLSRSSGKVPESKAISGNRNNTGLIEKDLIQHELDS